MSELMRRAANSTVSYGTVRAVARVAKETRLEQATIRAISTIGEYAVSEVQYLKKVQAMAEANNLDAADAVAAIVNITVASIAHRVARFAREVDW